MRIGLLRTLSKRSTGRLLRIGIGIGVVTSLGCNAALTSSTSASQGMGSVSSLSESLVDAGSSLASSSSGGEESAALERDVTTYTALFVESGGDADAFLRGVGALCEAYSLSDWEREPAVRRGIALGLARTDLTEEEIARFLDGLADQNGPMREGLHAVSAAPR